MKVAEWAKKNNVKVVGGGSSSKHFISEDSPYAMYKYLGEQVCKLYKKATVSRLKLLDSIMSMGQKKTEMKNLVMRYLDY